MSASLDQASRIERLCASKRLRMTGQRRVIARVLSIAKDHPDVEEVHRRAHAVDAVSYTHLTLPTTERV